MPWSRIAAAAFVTGSFPSIATGSRVITSDTVFAIEHLQPAFDTNGANRNRSA